jgi:lysophospholipase L1-like esterase
VTRSPRPTTIDVNETLHDDLPARPRSRSREILGRLLLVVGGLLVGLVLLEVALRVAAAVRHLGEEPQRFAWQGTGTRVLTVGDSNTFGLLVEPEEAYPRVFERLWNVLGAGDGPIEVMNLGRPGMNSSHARTLLDATLQDLRPQVLFLMLGVNDSWTLADTSIWERSRVVRLFTMLWVSIKRPHLLWEQERQHLDVAGRSIEFEFAGYGGRVPDWDVKMLANVREIIAKARGAGIEVVLLTYPADDGFYANANRRIRRLAREEHVPVIDLGLAFRRRCPAVAPDCKGEACRPETGPWVEHSRCGLLLTDGHPSVAGHEAAAQEVLAAYQRMHRPR